MFLKFLLKSVIDVSIVQKTSLYRNTVLLFFIDFLQPPPFPLELLVLDAKFASLLPGIKYWDVGNSPCYPVGFWYIPDKWC